MTEPLPDAPSDEVPDPTGDARFRSLPDPRRTTTTFTRPGADDLPTLLRPVAPELVPAGTVAPPSRYRLNARLEGDAAGRTYAADDLLLGRQIEVRILHADRAGDQERRGLFLHEARVAALLDHPAIAPIYDLERSGEGDLYLTTRRSGGSTLTELMARSGLAAPPWRQLVGIVQQAAEALAHAHVRGVVHADLRPDCLLIADDGRVTVTGWRSALLPGETLPRGTVLGTPAYLSPEQARGEGCTPASDIYCLGAVLWHALTGQPPTWNQDEQAFWERKRRGELDPPPISSLLKAPAAVLDAVRKALAAEPGLRFKDMAAFAVALDCCLTARSDASGPYAAVPGPGRRRRLLRWAALLLLAAGLATTLGPRAWERLRDGPLVLRETFADDGWKEKVRLWRHSEDRSAHSDAGFRFDNGRVVSTGRFANVLVLDAPGTGDWVVEFTGEVLPDARPGDLSLAWTTHDPFSSAQRPIYRSTILQVGAFDNEFSMIALEGGRYPLAMSPFRLEVGKRHRLRYEVGPERLAVTVDGRQIMAWEGPPESPRKGWVCLYCYYPGKAISDLTVRRKEPSLQKPWAAGDQAMLEESFERAEREYDKAAKALGSGTDWQWLRYKQGLALIAAGETTRARGILAAIDAEPVAPWAGMRLLELDARADRAEAAIEAFASLYRAHPALRQNLDQVWVRQVNAAASTQAIGSGSLTSLWTGGSATASTGAATAWLGLMGRPVQHSLLTDSGAARALFALGRYADIENDYGHIESIAANALVAQGRDLSALARYPERLGVTFRCLFNLGRFAELVQHPLADSGLRERALLLAGQHQHPLLISTAVWWNRAWICLLAGRVADLESLAFQHPEHANSILALLDLHLGDPAAGLARQDGRQERLDRALQTNLLLRLDRHQEALAAAPDPGLRRLVLLDLALEAQVRQGREQQEQAAKALAAMPRPYGLEYPGWAAEWILLPAAAQLRGTTGAVAAARLQVEKHHSHHWAGLALLATRLVAGELSPEQAFATCEAHAVLRSLIPFCAALRADLSGDAAEARRLYQAYLALPLHQRLWLSPAGDPSVDRFAAWRTGQLQP